jgi:hypothetical protein
LFSLCASWQTGGHNLLVVIVPAGLFKNGYQGLTQPGMAAGNQGVGGGRGNRRDWLFASRNRFLFSKSFAL